MSDASRVVVNSWAAEWGQEFDQDLDEERVEAYVGHRVEGVHEPRDADGNLTAVPRRFVRNIIGYSKMVIWVKGPGGDEEATVERWGLIDDEGKMLSIYSGMDLRVADDVEEEG